MFSDKKCKRCEGKLKEEFSFCPFCSLDLRNPSADMREFGMLGKNDSVFNTPLIGGGGVGINDSVVNSIFSNVMKMMENQLKNLDSDSLDFGDSKPEISRLPNGIQIKMGPSMRKNKPSEPKVRVISEDQRARMTKLPRGQAKAEIRRLSDKIIYELATPGVSNVEDIFVSKVESGYEVKAVGSKKVYFNSLQINLPLKKYFVKENCLTLEFGLEQI
ncbi:hypothetical protein J4416_02015 [Candidatus Pacearchaeota archaeon]|nr:hypothetical protein [Candidatus Pacearchaeota archaeon]HLC73605.1 hypothetical protein [Candidatus Nanoarchaeia archaeon]